MKFYLQNDALTSPCEKQKNLYQKMGHNKLMPNVNLYIDDE